MTGQERYAEYLTSKHWQNLRLAVLWRDDHRCKRCGREHFLQVHHKIYRARWEDTQPEDLVTLCNKCHKQVHNPKKGSRKRLIKKQRRKMRIATEKKGQVASQIAKRIERKREKISALTYLFGDKPISFSVKQ